MGSLRSREIGMRDAGIQGAGSRVCRWAWREEWWWCLENLEEWVATGYGGGGVSEIARSREGTEGTDAEEMTAVRRCGV